MAMQFDSSIFNNAFNQGASAVREQLKSQRDREASAIEALNSAKTDANKFANETNYKLRQEVDGYRQQQIEAMKSDSKLNAFQRKEVITRTNQQINQARASAENYMNQLSQGVGIQYSVDDVGITTDVEIISTDKGNYMVTKTGADEYDKYDKDMYIETDIGTMELSTVDEYGKATGETSGEVVGYIVDDEDNEKRTDRETVYINGKATKMNWKQADKLVGEGRASWDAPKEDVGLKGANFYNPETNETFVARSEADAKDLISKGYKRGKQDTSGATSSRDINKKKLEISNIKRQINTAKKKGDTNTELQLNDSLMKAKDELNLMTGNTSDIKQVEEKDYTYIEVIKTTTNPKAINTAINKMVESDEEGFTKKFLEQDYDTQVKMLDSGNQFATNAYIETASAGLSDILEKGSIKDEKGFEIYPSQQLNRQLKEIQSMDMNKESKKILTDKLIGRYENIASNQTRDVDSRWFSGDFVENLFRGKAGFDDQDDRNFSIQKYVEDKADYTAEYMGGVQLDPSVNPFASSERFNNGTMTVMSEAYRKLTGRELTPEAWQKISESGWERDKFNPDIVGDAGSPVKGSTLDKLLRLIFKSKIDK